MTPTRLEHTAAVLQQLLTFRQPADATLSAYLRRQPKLGRQDRHDIAETAFAALRHLQKIQSVIPEPHRQARLAALAALVVGRGDNISQLQALLHASEYDVLATLKAHKAAFSGSLNTAAELPEWLIAHLQAHWSEPDILAFGRAATTPAPLDVRVNTRQAKRDKVLNQLKNEFPDALATPYAPHGIRLPSKPALNCHPLFLDGTLEVQDEGSQLLAALVQAKRGEIVVDFCAGAGGKTLALGAQMANTGRIYAFDISEKRLSKLKPRAARAGLNNISTERISGEHDPRLRRLHGKADRVLVDAPCSGLGTLRRNPDLKYRQSPASISQLIEQQQEILQAAAKLVRDGGLLVYATCSVLPEENTQQAERFLAQQPDFALLNCAERLAEQKIPLDTGAYLQLNTAEHGTDGFFAAVFRKSSA